MKRGGERWREVKRGEARCREVKPGCGHDLPYLYTYPFVGPREWGRDTKSSWVLSRSTGWVQIRCTYREYERLYPYEWDAVWGRGMLSLSRRDVRRWRRAVVEMRGQSPDVRVQRMRATNQGLRDIRRHTTLACEESQLNVADECGGGRRERKLWPE